MMEFVFRVQEYRARWPAAWLSRSCLPKVIQGEPPINNLLRDNQQLSDATL